MAFIHADSTVRAIGNGRISSIVRGIEWVLAHPRQYNIRLINLSLGMPPTPSYQLDVVYSVPQPPANRGQRPANTLARALYTVLYGPLWKNPNCLGIDWTHVTWTNLAWDNLAWDSGKLD